MKAVCIRPIVGVYSSRYGKVLQDEILFGQEAEISAEQWGIARVEAFYRYGGFAEASGFLPTTLVCREWMLQDKYIVGTSFAAVLALPQPQSRVIVNLPRAAVVARDKEQANGFVRIVLPWGAHGYIEGAQLRSIVKPLCCEGLRDALCANALSYLGCQYLWGGKTPLGIDCSGLIAVSCLLQGLVVYRDASLRDGFAAKEISFDNAQKGDLVYFDGHVAMLLGNGRYVHSTNYAKTRGVCIASFNEGDKGYRADLHHGILLTASVMPPKP